MTSISPPRTAHAYIRWALALLGALLLIALSQITTVEPGEVLASPDDLDMTLGGISLIEQTFTTTQPDLVGLSVRLRLGDSGDANLRIPIHLRYADGPPIDLISTSIAPDNAEGGMISIYFPPLIASRDPYLITGTLRLTLDIPEIPPNTGPMITIRKNPAAQGGLIIDGIQQSDADLTIIPLYQIHWADRIWPISAMATGKPWLLGQPLFYVLLGYLYILMLGAGITALRQAQATTLSDT